MINLTDYLFQHQFSNGFNRLLTPEGKWRAAVYAYSHDLRQLEARLVLEHLCVNPALAVCYSTEKEKEDGRAGVSLTLTDLQGFVHRDLLKKATRSHLPAIRYRAGDVLQNRLRLSQEDVFAGLLVQIAGTLQFTRKPGYHLTEKEVEHLIQALKLPITLSDPDHPDKEPFFVLEFPDSDKDPVASVYREQVSVPVHLTRTRWGEHAHTRAYHETPSVDNSSTLHAISEVLATLYSIQIPDLLTHLAGQEGYAGFITELEAHQHQGRSNLLEMHIALMEVGLAQLKEAEAKAQGKYDPAVEADFARRGKRYTDSEALRLARYRVRECEGSLEILNAMRVHFGRLMSYKHPNEEARDKRMWVTTGAVSAGVFALSAAVLIAAVVPAWSAFGIADVPSMLLQSGPAAVAAVIGIIALVVGVIALSELSRYRVPRAPRGRLSSLSLPWDQQDAVSKTQQQPKVD